MFGVFYIIDKQSNENNVVLENYTIEQLKKCDAVSKQADLNKFGDVDSYRLNCKNNKSIEVGKQIYDLQIIPDVTPEISNKQIIFKYVLYVFNVSLIFFFVTVIFIFYRKFRYW